MIGHLVAGSGGNICSVIADGAYDGEPTYAAIRTVRPLRSPPKIVISPKEPSIPDKSEPHGGGGRERHAAEIARCGRIAWQRRHGYGKRSLVETAIPASSASMADASQPELSAPSRTKSPSASRSPIATCRSQGQSQSASAEPATKSPIYAVSSVRQSRTIVIRLREI